MLPSGRSWMRVQRVDETKVRGRLEERRILSKFLANGRFPETVKPFPSVLVI